MIKMKPSVDTVSDDDQDSPTTDDENDNDWEPPTKKRRLETLSEPKKDIAKFLKTVQKSHFVSDALDR